MDTPLPHFGWNVAQAPHSCGYLAPCILKILRRLNLRRVLDLGAGNGALCSLLAEAGMDPVGVECDARGIEIAQKACPRIPFHRYGVEDDPGELMRTEQRFDAVVSTEVIEHLYSPHLLPRYAAGVLKDGGFLIVSTPYHGYLKNLLLSLMNAWDRHHNPLWHGGHIKFWSRKTLSLLLTRSGFDVLEFHGTGRFPWLWKSMVLVARKTPGADNGGARTATPNPWRTQRGSLVP